MNASGMEAPGVKDQVVPGSAWSRLLIVICVFVVVSLLFVAVMFGPARDGRAKAVSESAMPVASVALLHKNLSRTSFPIFKKSEVTAIDLSRTRDVQQGEIFPSATLSMAGAAIAISKSSRQPEPAVGSQISTQSFPAVGEAGAAGLRPAGVGPDERWIDVNLTNQTLVAYQGDSLQLSSLISSGLWDTPTVTGQFRTWLKYESQDMNGYLLGYDYYLTGVPFVMYFYQDYAIHGAYWHNNFGTPMSHGCVNMNPADAGWLFQWAPVGTLVNVHY